MFKQIFGAVKAFGSKHSTAITSVVTIAGYAATVILAIHETRTFDERMEELKINNDGKEVSKKDIAVTAVKSYWPAITTFGVTTVCHIGGQWAMVKKYNALSAAYATTTTAHNMLEKSFKDYKAAVEKTISEKKQQEIDHEVNVNKAKQITKEQVDELREHTGYHGEEQELYMDGLTGRIFYSTPANIQIGLDAANKKYVREGEITYDDILEAWGLDTYGNSNVTGKLVYRYDIEGEQLDFTDDRNVKTPDGYHVTVIKLNMEPRFQYS